MPVQRNQLDEVKNLVMEFMRTHRISVDGYIPTGLFNAFIQMLHLEQQQLVDAALKSFVSDGVIAKIGDNYNLTAHGFEMLYQMQQNQKN